MKQRIIVSSEELRNRCFEILSTLPLSPVHEVTFREYKKDRSASQFGLYWIWMSQISGYTGETKDDVHRRMKKKHLIPIYMEDPESGMTATVMAVRAVHAQGMKDHARVLAEKIIDLVSTSDASVKQFTSYLEEIEKECISQGIYLPHPEDMWYEAMGTKP